MLRPQLMKALSLDESVILCEILPTRLVLADSQGGEAQLARPVA